MRVAFLATAMLFVLPVVALAGGVPNPKALQPFAGAWEGSVAEIGLARYELKLVILSDGKARAEYPGFGCRSSLAPSKLGGLVLHETVVEGRDRCADGMVELEADGTDLRWLWHDGSGAVRAAGRLVRSD